MSGTSLVNRSRREPPACRCPESADALDLPTTATAGHLDALIATGLVDHDHALAAEPLAMGDLPTPGRLVLMVLER
ncbi:hypothetical protein ACQPZF_35650 [Actinosynnema sp. CS-041913]|uniref:hypothetical protein n=1 Tax=Actinosynnema sp. CS-041913 TaxID=3239917 RepID=UPI003D8FFD00